MKEKINYFPQTIHNGTIVSEWEKEYELPTDLLDVSRLIRIDSSPKINNVSIDDSQNTIGKSLEVKGENVFNLIYHSSEDDKIHSVEFSDDFILKEDLKTASDEIIPSAKVFCTFVNCKVISKRKFYIKAKNKVSFDVKENVVVKTPDIEENDQLFFNTNSFSLQNYLQPTFKTFNLEETLVLDGTYPPVENIIFSTVKIIPMDLIKGIGNATLNTSVLFKVFYESANGYSMYSRTVPVSLSVTDDDIDESTLLYYYLSIANQNVNVEMDNYGEERILKFNYTPALILFKVKEFVSELPIDVFSTTDILEPKLESVRSESLVSIVQRPFTIEKVFEVPEVDFIEIYDSAAVIDVESISENDDGKTITGLCAVSIFGLTDKGIECANFNVNFNQLFPESKNGYLCECSVSPTQTSATISGRNMISFRVSANATIRQYKENNFNFLTGFSPKEKRNESEKDVFTLYYPSKSETLWDVSKIFGKDPKSLAKDNSGSFNPDGTFNTKSINVIVQ